MYYFIVNPGSRTGKGSLLWDEIEKKLNNSKTEYEVFFTEKSGDATAFARQICEEHPEMKRIVIVGGDGTANQAINGLSNYNRFILGYVPTGSGNDLARGLGICTEMKQACENALHPHFFKRVDHGLVQSADGAISRKFGVSSGMGYDADICARVENSKLKKFLNRFGLGKLVYYLIGLKLVFTNKPARATVTIDGKRMIKCKKLIFAANMNTVYEGGGMPMGPHADPTDGKVTMLLLHDVSKLWHLRLMPTIIKSRHVGKRGVDEITAKTIEIETDRPLWIHTDGEVVGKSSHVTFSCLPDKARMIIK